MKSFAPGRGALSALLFLALPVVAQQSDRRPVTIDDQFAIKDVSDPQISPDGKWVAYVVSQRDLEDDLNQSDVWMTSWDGATTIQLTHTKKESESDPSWSPDGKYLAFLSDREDENDASQLWLLNAVGRGGGTADRWQERHRELTPGRPTASGWCSSSRTATRWKSVGSDTTHKETPKPIVIDRYYFKEDYIGYLGRKRTAPLPLRSG